MKTKRVFGLFSLLLIIAVGCEKEDGIDKRVNYQENAKLKRVLLYASVDAKDPKSIVDEYEYDNQDRIQKVTSPMYANGVITGIGKYAEYEYNSSGQLVKISNFNANYNSPTGFINLKNHIYTYTENGLIEMDYIEYPQIDSFEYSLFSYTKNKPVKVEKYNNKGELEVYIIYEYNESGDLIKEKSHTAEDGIFSVTVHLFTNGLNTMTEVYSGNQEIKVREIIKTYDINRNLIMIESIELMAFSAMASYVLKYEYFEE